MAKVQIKSEQITPFGGIFCVMEEFDALLSNIIDSTLGPRTKTFGYQYSEIFRSLMCVYFCGGSCVEDISTHLMSHLSFHPVLRSCSADTILRAIKELTVPNITYTSSVSGNPMIQCGRPHERTACQGTHIYRRIKRGTEI